jgi:hypothetical protein
VCARDHLDFLPLLPSFFLLILFFFGFPIPNQSILAKTTLFSKWKTISGVLLQPQYGESLIIPEMDPRRAVIAQTLALVEPILRPFVITSRIADGRQRNLESVMKRAAQFAFLMFSQPGVFGFDFSVTPKSEAMVIFPAFVQTVNDEAELLSSPRVLTEQELVTVGGGV